MGSKMNSSKNAQNQLKTDCQKYIENRITKSGVAILDVLLPQGIPRNSFVMVGGEAGTGKSALVAELAYRTLHENQEPVIYVLTENSPLALYHRFLGLGWDIESFIEKQTLRIIDAFTPQINQTPFDKDQSRYIQFSDINADIRERLDSVTSHLNDPSNIELLIDRVYRWMNRLNMVNRGLIIIDSITELYSRSGNLLFLALKNLRTIACSIRFVPVWGVAHFGLSDSFPSGFDYLSDGLIDLRFEKTLMEQGLLMKQLRIRRMSGIKSYPLWVYFDIEPYRGCISTSLNESLKTELETIFSNLTQANDGFEVEESPADESISTTD